MWQTFWSLTLASETSWTVMVEILFSTSVLCVLVYCFSIVLKQWRLVSCDNAIEKVLIDLACLDEIFTDFDSAPFLIYNSAWNKICTDPPLSIIFINSITNYFPVSVQLILPSIFVFYSVVSWTLRSLKSPKKGKEGCRDGIPRVARNFTVTLEGLIPKSGVLLWEVISQQHRNKHKSI